jgi:hypothetical protein
MPNLRRKVLNWLTIKRFRLPRKRSKTRENTEPDACNSEVLEPSEKHDASLQRQNFQKPTAPTEPNHVSPSDPEPSVSDLSQEVRLTATHAVACGGFADIYRGEWDSNKGEKPIQVRPRLILLNPVPQNSDHLTTFSRSP